MKLAAASRIDIFRLAAGTLGWIALIVQFWATVFLPAGSDIVPRIVTYFSYFTMQSNIFAAAVLTLPELGVEGRITAFLRHYAVRTAMTVYMIVTGVIYALFLAGPPSLTVQFIADVVLHYIMPPLCVIAWLRIVPERPIAWSAALSFLIFPILFGLYTLARGALTGIYPYSFLDVGQHGYPRILINCAGLLLLCLALSILLIGIGRWRAARSLPAKAAAPSGRGYGRDL
jgi:hypothetical protein